MSVLLILGLTVVALSLSDAQTVDAKKPSQKCNNVKVLLKVSGVEENQTVIASVTLGDIANTKSGVVDVNETDIAFPFLFKKLNPCPDYGTAIYGNVNGTGFNSTLKSLQKPNKVTVDLS